MLLFCPRIRAIYEQKIFQLLQLLLNMLKYYGYLNQSRKLTSGTDCSESFLHLIHIECHSLLPTLLGGLVFHVKGSKCSKTQSIMGIQSVEKIIIQMVLLKTSIAQNQYCSKQVLLKTSIAQKKYCSKQVLLKTSIAQNKYCLKQVWLKISIAQNQYCSKQVLLITIIAQTKYCKKQVLLKTSIA